MTLKKTICLLCMASLMLPVMTACKNGSSTVKPAGESESYKQTTTQVTQTAVIGEEAEMSDIEIKINKIYRSEYTGSKNGIDSNVVFLEITVKNNTNEEISPNMLSSFTFDADGEEYDFATLLAINSAKKQFGSDVELFSRSIRPSESRTGYIPAELPQEFETITVKFLPLGSINSSGNSSQAIVYTFTADDMEDIAKP